MRNGDDTAAVKLLDLATIGSLVTNVGGLLLFFAPADEDVPAAALVVGIVLAVAAVAGAWGLWRRERWGKWVTIVVNVLAFLSAIPGFGAGPGAVLLVGLVLGMII